MKLKQANKKDKGQKNFKGYLVGAVLAFMLALLVYALLVLAEDTVLEKYETVEYLAFKEDMKKGTKIEDVSVFAIVNVAPQNAPANAITDFSTVDMLVGTYLSSDVDANAMCTSTDFVSYPPAGEGTKTLSLSVDAPYKCVSGTLRPSDHVDIYIVPPSYKEEEKTTEYDENGYTYTKTDTSYEVLTKTYENVFIDKTFDADGIEIGNADTGAKTVQFEITVSAEEADEIVSMIALGYTVYLVKVN